MVVAILSFWGIFHSCELHAFERRPSLAHDEPWNRLYAQAVSWLSSRDRRRRRRWRWCCPCGGGGSGVAAGKCRELALLSAFLDDTQGRTRGCRKIFADKLFGIAIRYRKELQILLNIEKDERKVIWSTVWEWRMAIFCFNRLKFLINLISSLPENDRIIG